MTARPRTSSTRTARRRIWWAAGCILLAACGSDGASPDGASPEIAGLRIESGQSSGHTEDGVAYSADPPSGGDHAPRWLNCGIYDEPVPLEPAVHALEHGAVWIAHAPDLPTTEIDILHQLADRAPGRLVIAPYPGLADPVVAVAWERRLAVPTAADDRLMAFVDAFVNGAQSPEPGAPCEGGIDPREG